MHVMIVGGGGREHALALALRKNAAITDLSVLPGNGGIAAIADCYPVTATDIDGICAFAAGHKVDFAVVAQDDPLAMGAVDRLQELGVRCFGPTAAAARIESSKRFAKALMQQNGIPTARYEAFSAPEAALSYLAAHSFPAVIKTDGLALGKGVFIVSDMSEARAAIHALMETKVFGRSGDNIIVEEFLVGPEVTVLAFTDGQTLIPMVSSMDHKRALDGDLGPNTGGMGVIAPNPFYTKEIAARCMEEIFLPTVRAMAALGCPFRGCLYFGLMLTNDGPKVIEYNCRFGDPEAQAVLPLLESDLMDIMLAVSDGRLTEDLVRFSHDASCCVVVASGGYPERYEKGFPISLDGVYALPNVTVYHAGTANRGGELVTAGGRVLGVTAKAPTLKEARALSYAAVGRVRFQNAYYRNDIGLKAEEA